MLAKSLIRIGFTPSHADSDMWMKDCGTHYEYICTYVDDILIMSKDPMAIIKLLEEEYPLKGVGTPEYYLGGDLTMYRNKDGKQGLSTSAKTYIKRVCEKIERLLDWKLRNYGSPMEADYHPELDEGSILNQDLHAKYRMMIGSLNWMVTLGRFDIYYATQTMARYSMAPREGHMKAMQRLFGYLKHHPKLRIEFDTKLPDHTHYESPKFDWFEFYGKCSEELPPNMPTPKGNPVKLTAFFDADHAGCLVTRRSTTGMLLFLNNTPIQWYSKRQATVESATYGSEMVAGRITVEFVIAMRYKLRMMGIPLLGSCILFGDNMSMITSATIPLSSLKKKHNAIGYHRIREAVAAGIATLVHVISSKNIADIFTKPLGPQVFGPLLKNFCFPVLPARTHEGECQSQKVNVGETDLSTDVTRESLGIQIGIKGWDTDD